MRGAHRTPTVTTARPSAVAWVDERHAIVARSIADDIVVSELAAKTAEGRTDTSYLTRVVDEIGDQDRLVILGPSSTRLALEREYVTIFHRPDRLLDVEFAEPLGRDAIVERLRSIRS
jgi:hypothetical protein